MRGAAIAVALLFAVPLPALAHAHLSSSVPAENADVAAPDRVVLSFSQALEKRFSSAEIRGPADEPVAGASAQDDADPAKLVIHLPAALPPGSYTVVWHATSVDTHRTEGKFRFTVAAKEAGAGVKR